MEMLGNALWNALWVPLNIELLYWK